MNEEKLPNSTKTLVLGIISLAGLSSTVIGGIIMSAVALNGSSNDSKLLKENPEKYTKSSAKMHKIGRNLSWIGIGVSVLYIPFWIWYFYWIGDLFSDIYSNPYGVRPAGVRY